MSEPFNTVPLECHCIANLGEQDCTFGGEIDAILSVEGAVLLADIETVSKVVSPPEIVQVQFAPELEGSGPYFIVEDCTDEENCELVETNWDVTINYTLNEEVLSVDSKINNVYSNGSYLIFSNEPDLINDDTVINSILASGLSSPTPPRIEKDVNLAFPTTDLIGSGLIVGSGTSETPPNLQSDLIFDDQELIGSSELLPEPSTDYSIGELLTFNGEFTQDETDKIAGEFGDFYCVEKLYPSGDLPLDAGFGAFSGPMDETSELYTFIDEGVYEGVLIDRGDATLLSDDEASWLQPNTVHTEGLFQYKCELSELNVEPANSSFRIRVSAPITNYESNIPPLYTIFNIRLSDPSGNLIVKYNDIQLKGDSTRSDHNYTTYSSLPELNAMDRYEWQRVDKPHMHLKEGYRLQFSVRAVALDDPFDPGFDAGFEENYIIPDIFTDGSGNNYLALDGSPLSTQETRFLNPTEGFKFSAVEICNSGGYGPRRESFVPMRVPVRDKGLRLERCIRPRQFYLNDFDTSIYPSVNTIWEAEGYQTYGETNEDVCGAKILTEIIKDKSSDKYVSLQSVTGQNIADSGKLVLKFGECFNHVDEITNGAFNFEFDQSTKKIWWEPSGAFNVENRREDIDTDSIFYNFESITLKVLAKKAEGSRDYILDVVGYSDDKLLNRTSASGGFLQSPSGVCLNDVVIASEGVHPIISGFYGDDSSLSEMSLSSLDDYYEASGNDHYKILPYPIVTSTEFQWYEVPLEILDEEVRYGLPTDYKQSPKLEHIYLDIFPLPSSASIAYAELCVRYAPQSAFNMYSQGGEKFGKGQDGRNEGRLFPSGMYGNDAILNYGSGYQPISYLEDLPHLYSGGETLKTNYSRRWRGVEGTVRGPYDIDQFDFGYENPVIDYPFLSGYFKFDNFGPENRYALSVDMGPASPSGLGTLSGLHFPGEPEVYHNLGWRFASGTLFSDHLPLYSGNYTSTDWTALSKGNTTFVGNPMYGKIADAFDRVVRLSGEAGQEYFNFGNVDVSGGFAIFTRFTPDSNISGVNYNLFDSGVIVSKWTTDTDMDFALGYENGFLCGFAQDVDGNIIKVTDSHPYSGYQYPLNTILTYNDSGNHRLRLYTDNEFASGDWEVLRATSSPFHKNANDADLVLGYAAGSGVGINMLVSEFGVSTYSSGVDTLYGFGTNIVASGADRTYKGVTADTFLENSRVKYFEPGETYLQDRYKLWDRVNEDTYNDWNLGDFKFCEFNFEFSDLASTVGKRPNTEQIVFHIKHPGSGYSQLNTLPMLSEIDSGVAYHTQMENDFLRFHLSDVEDNFYAVNKRITKNIPCGYKFSDRALVVETVVNHKFASGMYWDSCEDINPSGPRLIVSLYSKNKEPYWKTDEPNWGLINRKIHYIKPSSCLHRLDSTFSYDDLCDETESWAILPREPRLREFTETYFSQDINDMFVQYDLVYPSGPAFESRIEMHSSHVRMADVNLCASGVFDDTFPLNVSGAFREDSQINLNIGGFPRDENGILPMAIQVPFPFSVFDEATPSGFTLNVSGAFVANTTMPFVLGQTIPDTGIATFNLNISGGIPPEINDTMNLALPKVFGRIDVSTDGRIQTTPGALRGQTEVNIGGEVIVIDGPNSFDEVVIVDNQDDGSGSVTFSGGTLTISGDISNSNLDATAIQSQIDNQQDFTAAGANGAGNGSATEGSKPVGKVGDENYENVQGLPLTILNADISTDSGGYLNLSTLAPSEEGFTALQTLLNTVVFNNQQAARPATSASGTVTLNLLGGRAARSTIVSESMPLYIKPLNKLEENLSLYIHNPEVESLYTDSINLFTSSYNVGSKGFGSAYGLWDGVEYGTGIEIEDNVLAAIPVDNEIRGVDLTAYGACTGDSPSKAIDKALVTDCTVWREETCNEAGAFRAKDTYTNLLAENFEGELGYSGNYYGIRKYTQLIPATAYDATMTIKTGNTLPIDVPRDFEEWEYGMCGPDWLHDSFDDPSGCCNEVCEQNIVFSGIKFVGDDSGINIDGDEYDPELLIASGRQADAKFGSRVKVKGDLMAIAAPDLTIPDFDPTRNIENVVAGIEGAELDPGPVDVSGAGAVFLYRRGEDVPGQKANWTFEEQLMLPPGFRKDYIQRTTQSLLRFDYLSISGNKWQIGQEGRRFGESLDICSSGDREMLVVGAPRAKWGRQFDDIETSGIKCGTLMVADLFDYDKKKLKGVAGAAQEFNIMWKYFSPPWGTPPDEWYAQVETNVIVLQLTYFSKDYPVVPTDESAWFKHKYIPRLDDLDLIIDIGNDLVGEGASLSDKIAAAQPVIFDAQFSGVKECFDQMFPLRNQVVYSGLPPILGMFKEQTGSTAGALNYTDANTNAVRNLYDRIEDYYLNWTYSSGVYDFVQGIHQSGHLNTVIGKSEDVYETTRNLIDVTFDSGRLSNTFTNETLNRNFIASGIGQEWGDTHSQVVNTFQLPPSSGGRVYIFEKERGNFNCIQVVVSPDDISDLNEIGPGDIFSEMYSFTPNDRFGHSVAISANSEVITIGSPWKTTPARIYERNDAENQRVYDNVRNFCVVSGLSDAVAHYDAITVQSGEDVAKTSTYDHIGPSERFSLRNNDNYWDGKKPNPYELSFGYSYSDIAYAGTNTWLATAFAPTSRLGWSTSVSEDGNRCVFGAPTDSFNIFEDVNVYGTGLNRWASYVHGGAVRVFESRTYHPHSGIVEFGRFGNLDRATHKTERDLGLYDQWNQIFASGADGQSEGESIPFRRMDFSEIEIPRDVGLCFITTPELDAASDEIIQNIKDWLALGDRNLVLVGNDPVWEENGLYKESNDVVNKILKKLDSRMRIFPARNESYAMHGTLDGECVSQDEINADLYNVTTVPPPAYTTGPTIQAGNYYGKGFGDIRIDLTQDGLEDYLEYFECPEGKCCDDCGDDGPPIVNDKCEFPLKHEGDLRASWTETCIKSTPRGCKVVKYKKNWPFQFGNFTPPCDDPPPPIFRKRNQEPVPVLTTMEHVPPSSWYRDGWEEEECSYTPIYEWRVRQAGSTTYKFAPHNVDYVEFFIQEDSEGNTEGIFDGFSVSGPDFIDPEAKNGRDGLVQGIGRSYYPEDEERTETRIIYPFNILAIAESGRSIESGEHNNSSVYLMATQWSEDENSRGIDEASLNDDKNTEFYINMVRKNCNDAPKGIQINGFTGQASLADAYYTGADASENHKLANTLNFQFSKNDNGGFFYENKDTTDIKSFHDFIWIAQPLNKPSANDISLIREWMDIGNKKIILTYNSVNRSTRQDTAEIIDYICEQLGMTSRPFYIPSIGEYFVAENVITGYKREDGPEQKVDLTTEPLEGCEGGYGFAQDSYPSDTNLLGVEFHPETQGNDTSDEGFGGGLNVIKDFVPISGGETGSWEKVIWYNENITENYTVYPTNRYKIDGEAIIDFPVVKNSGYRMFVNWVSEVGSEKFNICGNLDGASSDPAPSDGEFDEGGSFFDNSSETCGTPIDLEKTTTRTPQQTVIDFRATQDSLTVDLNTDIWKNGIPRDLITEGVLPTTPRFLSISGCPLEIISETVITTTSGKVIVGYEETCETFTVPATSGSVPGFSRPVQHLSEPYCKPGGYSEDKCEEANFEAEYIQDGPVIVAEEPEQFSSFPAGRRKSHIIVIADSTLVQGQCPAYRGSDAIEGNQKLIRSLYPSSPENYDEPQDDAGFFPDGAVGGNIEPREEGFNNVRNWYFAQKIRAPEVGSPAKYHAVSGASIQNMIFTELWGAAGGPTGDFSRFVDGEDYLLDPTVELGRPAEERNRLKQIQIKINFNDNALSEYGQWPRFSGDFLTIIPDNPNPPEYYNELLGELPPIEENQKSEIADAGVGGGMSDLMRATNTDYLDFDVYNSGCAGDLFGWSVDISQDRLIVGTPFNGFYNESGVSGCTPWYYIENNISDRENMIVAEDGGAGAAFIFGRTGSGENLIKENLPWEFTQKIRPSSINAGIYDFRPSPNEALTAQRGPHQINNGTVIISGAKQSDRFGWDVAIDCDMCVIGAPNHDFQTIHSHIYSGGGLSNINNIDPEGLNTAFVRKSFTAAFDIPKHEYWDLGDSGNRVDRFSNQSGVMVLNAGAVFSYRNKLVDFQKREQEWRYAEKLVAQSGYKGREQGKWDLNPSFPFNELHITSGNEFDNYGKSVSIYRANRGDGDYTTVIGSPNHIWPVSGDHRTKDLRDAGAAFTYDAMLREQTAAIPNSGGWIDAHVFGNKKTKGSLDRLETRVYQNETGPVEEYQVSGIVFTNNNGDIFLEVSGFDPSAKGFIGHRPYVDNIKFVIRPGIEVNDTLGLNISGSPNSTSGDMNLVLLGAKSANVYNNLGMYNFGVSGIVYADGIDQSGLFLNITAPSGPIASSLNLNLTSTQSTGSLPLRMRGF